MEQLWFTKILNGAFHGPVDRVLEALHIPSGYLPSGYPQAPISNAVAMEILVLGILLVLFLLVRTQLSVESPSALQHAFEGLHGFIENQSFEIIGPHTERFTPFLLALGLFILLGNLFGIVPGLEAPTAYAVVPLGCAVCAFFYYHAHGFRQHGIAYLKHFLGPVWWLSWLMLPLEIVSHLARVLSLTIRLYANMFAGDIVTLVFFSLIPVVIPIAFLGLHIFVALLQAYIFVLLATVYLAGAVAVEH